MYLTRALLAFNTNVSPEPPNIAGSIPDIPYIFIISCIRRLSSETVIIEETFSSLIFWTLTSNLSRFKAFLNVSVNFSVASLSSSSLISSVNESFKSASILTNLTFSFFCSSCEMKGWSIASFNTTASIPSALNIFTYWLCWTGSFV